MKKTEKKTKAEKREIKKRPRMGVSGRSVFLLKRIIEKKAEKAKKRRKRSK